MLLRLINCRIIIIIIIKSSGKILEYAGFIASIPSYEHRPYFERRAVHMFFSDMPRSLAHYFQCCLFHHCACRNANSLACWSLHFRSAVNGAVELIAAVLYAAYVRSFYGTPQPNTFCCFTSPI